MPRERRYAAARRSVPELDGLVIGCRRKLAAVRREGYRDDQIAMPRERRYAAARRSVPELDGLVVGR